MGLITHKMGVNVSLKPFLLAQKGHFWDIWGGAKSTILGVPKVLFIKSLKPFLDDWSHWLYNSMVGENG